MWIWVFTLHWHWKRIDTHWIESKEQHSLPKPQRPPGEQKMTQFQIPNDGKESFAKRDHTYNNTMSLQATQFWAMRFWVQRAWIFKGSLSSFPTWFLRITDLPLRQKSCSSKNHCINYYTKYLYIHRIDAISKAVEFQNWDLSASKLALLNKTKKVKREMYVLS